MKFFYQNIYESVLTCSKVEIKGLKPVFKSINSDKFQSLAVVVKIVQ